MKRIIMPKNTPAEMKVVKEAERKGYVIEYVEAKPKSRNTQWLEKYRGYAGEWMADVHYRVKKDAQGKPLRWRKPTERSGWRWRTEVTEAIPATKITPAEQIRILKRKVSVLQNSWKRQVKETERWRNRALGYSDKSTALRRKNRELQRRDDHVEACLV